MKKVMALVFAVLLLAGMAACGGGGKSGSSNPGGIFEPDDPTVDFRDNPGDPGGDDGTGGNPDDPWIDGDDDDGSGGDPDDPWIDGDDDDDDDDAGALPGAVLTS